MTQNGCEERIIIALDVATVAEAVALTQELAPWVSRFKVGLELYSVAGPEAVRAVQAAGAEKVFLDLKLHDIPNTVRNAARAAAALGVEFITVHASGGVEMMRAAVAGAAEGGSAKILAVTVLTSLGAHSAYHIYRREISEAVWQFAVDAGQAGCWGIICSPQELAFLPERIRGEAVGARDVATLKFITPGVRPAWAAANDQQRVMTPGEAIRHGAYALVIGRPITRPPTSIGSPVDAARRIISELPE
ncbi:MAG: orotidine-5'-phosphate decarboxylase [Candidatus Magasanikbacteria bacterium]|nr:orotidine-5'-phosphate decarboxylase [Candidatus Magasanikbacteria bacterium]